LGKVQQEKILLCNSCGLAFLDLEDGYTYTHSDWYDWLRISEEVGKKYLNWIRWYYLKQLKILSGLVEGRELLDIGAGMGIFAKVASEIDWKVTCTEIHPKARAFGAQIYGLIYKELEDIPPESMDIVRVSHILEHVPEPLLFLCKVKSILKSGGICVTMVPHYEPLNCVIKNLILRLIPGEHDFRGHIYPPPHILGFTPFSLKNTFRLVGLHPLKIYSVSRGNRTYYPWKWEIIKPSIKDVIFELVNTLGNIFNRGSWIVGYFRKN